MHEKNYTFSTFSNFASDGICQSLIDINGGETPIIIICIGSDLVLGDSLGPLVGTFLKSKDVNAYVYGTLNFPITAKEVEYARTYLKKMHPNAISIAVDAAVGDTDDIGLIRVMNKGIKPGLGVDKNLGVVGDLGIVGIVAEKSLKNHVLFNLTRLNLVYKMAGAIADGIQKYISYQTNVNENKSYSFLINEDKEKGSTTTIKYA